MWSNAILKLSAAHNSRIHGIKIPEERFHPTVINRRLSTSFSVVILGDREFHGIELSYWLKQKNKKAKKPIYFAFREKNNIYLQRSRKNEERLKDLKLIPGVKVLHKNVKVTKQKGFGQFNLLTYKKRDYRHHKVKESWFIITNLSDPNEVIKLYKKRAGIEALQ